MTILVYIFIVIFIVCYVYLVAESLFKFVKRLKQDS